MMMVLVVVALDGRWGWLGSGEISGHGMTKLISLVQPVDAVAVVVVVVVLMIFFSLWGHRQWTQQFSCHGSRVLVVVLVVVIVRSLVPHGETVMTIVRAILLSGRWHRHGTGQFTCH